MRAGWRLALAVFAWAVSIPVMALAGSWLMRSVFRSVGVQMAMVHLMEVVLFLLAALIYWQCVPHAPEPGRRMLYLAGFVVLMGAIACLALGASFVLVMLFFGL